MFPTRCRAILAITAFLCLSLPGRAAWADCKAHQDQARSLLDTAKKSAMSNRHPNPDAFAERFKAIVDKMQAENCLVELMGLFQYAQAEQQKLPPPKAGKMKPAPIMD